MLIFGKYLPKNLYQKIWGEKRKKIPYMYLYHTYEPKIRQQKKKKNQPIA
jgi:hypothetical protein